MAKYQNKAGGPLRGRRRVTKMGMGSGKSRVQAHKNLKKGKRG